MKAWAEFSVAVVVLLLGLALCTAPQAEAGERRVVVLAYDGTFDPVRWRLGKVVRSWNRSPHVRIETVTGACPAWSEQCAHVGVRSTAMDETGVWGLTWFLAQRPACSGGDDWTPPCVATWRIDLAPEIDALPDTTWANMTRRYLACHEIGHVLTGQGHQDSTGCMSSQTWDPYPRTALARVAP